MHTHKVLVVDDDEVVRVMLDGILTEAGFSVTMAASPREAISHLPEGHPFAAVITDLMMPDQSGIELLRELRAGGQTDLPVIILTAYPSVDSAVAAVGDARVRYLTKADAHKQLLQSLRTLIGNGFAGKQLKSEPRLAQATGTQFTDDVFAAALEQLWIAFQPIVSWNERNAFGYEALVRSTHDVLPHPGRLFEAAEQLDRLPELGRQIRQQVADSIPQAPKDVRIFVNLHAADLNDDHLYSPDTGLALHAHRVVFEVTERASLQCVDNLQERLRHLRKLGFSIAVDDLGAGYAGLASLGQLEPEVVKLDMSLIRNIDTQPRIQRVVQSMLSAYSSEMEVRVVCEGVETPAERNTLTALGADLLQGYLFGRPSSGFVPPTF